MSNADLAVVLTGAARVVADRLGAAVERAGVEDMRSSFGFVIRALAERDRTLTELAELLSVTKQAAIKVVDDMEARGFVQRWADPTDRRTKVLRLTPKAKRVQRAAMTASRQMEHELREDLGTADVTAMRRALLRLLERHGGLADATAGRSRAVW
ncbi:MAG: MarR family transcriptional regulator [Actinomycetota bacterium]|nr:MarR family transcriptional regulator [Actinomycetota bacterium]